MSRKNQDRLPESVLILAYSPTRTVLVRNNRFFEPRWKLPGGGVERTDKDRTATALREYKEETGITLSVEDLLFCSWKRHADEHCQYIFVAKVTEEKLDTRLKIGDENGQPIQVAAFYNSEIPTMLDLLEHHRPFIVEAMKTTSVLSILIAA